MRASRPGTRLKQARWARGRCIVAGPMLGAPGGVVGIGRAQGLVAKGASTVYRPGFRGWQKIKHRTTEEAVIGAVIGPITRPESIVAGRYTRDGRLVIVGRSVPLSSAQSFLWLRCWKLRGRSTRGRTPSSPAASATAVTGSGSPRCSPLWSPRSLPTPPGRPACGDTEFATCGTDQSCIQMTFRHFLNTLRRADKRTCRRSKGVAVDQVSRQSASLLCLLQQC